MAILYFDEATMVRVDAVIVRHVQTIFHGHVFHQHALAAEQVQTPIRRVAKGDIAHEEIGAAGEDEHFRAPLFEKPPFARRIIARHERQRLAENLALAGDRQTRRVGRHDDAVAGIITLVRADEQSAIEPEFHAALEIQRGDEKYFFARNQNCIVHARRINRALNGRCIERRAVALRAEIEDVQSFSGGAKFKRQQDDEQK